MALVSPGVQVTVTDQSQYLPASTNSVPFILLATAQNKPTPSGVGIAAGTLKANANKTYLITSQQDLASTFGTPYFYQTSAGTPINGYELNEYGLLTAYTSLGVTNQCYVQRADIDLAALTASLTRPMGAPANGTTWLDTSTTAWGIFQWNQTTGTFTNQKPIVITDSTQISGGAPEQTVGSIGQYAVNATSIYNPTFFKRGGAAPSQTSDPTLQGLYNTWVLVGSNDWQSSWATVQGTLAPTSLTAGSDFFLNGVQILVPSAPNNTVADVMDIINSYNGSGAVQGVYAAVIGGALTLFADSQANFGTGEIVLVDGTNSPLVTLGITPKTYYAPAYQASPSYTVPRWASFDTVPEPTGSVWQKTNNVNLGTSIVVKRYSSTLGVWVQQVTSVYATDAAANYALDPSGGGALIPAGTTFAQVSPTSSGVPANTSGFQVFSRYATGAAQFTGTNTNPTFTVGDQFIISASTVGSADYNSATVNITGTTVSDFIADVSAADVPYVSASVSSSGAIVLEHSAGGDIILTDVTGNPVTDAGFNTNVLGVRNAYDTTGAFSGLTLSYWMTSPTFTYTATGNAPDTNPDNGTYWYYSDATVADIMVQDGGQWYGYQNVTQDVRGYNLSLTNATGPIFAASAPTTQTNASLSPLVYGDLWINTGDLENYPVISRWQNVNGQAQWVQISNADQTTTNGILFADARWGTNAGVDPIGDPLPAISGTGGLIQSNYLDIDAPNAQLYAEGTLLWNTRRSGFNVKTFEVNYFNNTTFPADDWVSTVNYIPGNYVMDTNEVYVALTNNNNLQPSANPSAWSQLTQTNAWVTQSGNRQDGSPYMGRQAQRAVIVKAMKAGVDSNVTIREEYNQFNLQAAPSYPELAPNLRLLNNDRGDTGFTVVDTPLRLSPNDVVTWATNNNGLGVATGDGLLVAGDTYAGAFYPSCLTNDTNGNQVVCPPSYMMVRTIIRSDQQSYPWFAPAGTQRGVVDNAQQLGYVDATTGEFITIGVRQGLRDVLYQNNVNPITYLPGVGITNFGNKTLQGTATALDRINVARLVAFLRGRLQEIGKQYLFQPNDQITRQSIANNVTSLMIDLIAKRGIYDYLVVCDSSNNTPARIDRNELWVDVAIEPVKAVEFIYIPLRILNTGAIAGGTGASAVGTGGTGAGT